MRLNTIYEVSIHIQSYYFRNIDKKQLNPDEN
jgi:hypothetical protein